MWRVAPAIVFLAGCPPAPPATEVDEEQSASRARTDTDTDVYDPEPPPSRWRDVPGADIGAGETNTQTSAKVLEATALIELGEVYRLGHVYDAAMPRNPQATFGLTLKPTFVFGDQVNNNEVLAADIGQVGTQLDAFGHFGWLPPDAITPDQAVYYDGLTGAEVVTPTGLQHLGAEHLLPLFTRGILLDVKRYRNANITLTAGYEITVEDVLETLEAQGLEPEDIREGDVVLFVTGWEEHWDDGPDVYYAGGPGQPGATPGIGLDVARWLSAKHVACVGSDNWGVEVAGGTGTKPEGIDWPVHHELLVRSGIPMQESMHLSELADDLAAEADGVPAALRGRVYTFAYIHNPLPIRGATGSPGAPLAVR